jgi:hypothetical protein
VIKVPDVISHVEIIGRGRPSSKPRGATGPTGPTSPLPWAGTHPDAAERPDSTTLLQPAERHGGPVRTDEESRDHC